MCAYQCQVIFNTQSPVPLRVRRTESGSSSESKTGKPVRPRAGDRADREGSEHRLGRFCMQGQRLGTRKLIGFRAYQVWFMLTSRLASRFSSAVEARVELDQLKDRTAFVGQDVACQRHLLQLAIIPVKPGFIADRVYGEVRPASIAVLLVVCFLRCR